VAWCEKTKEFFCIHCAPRHRKRASSFWTWNYYYELWCEKCLSYHPALDWLEFKGKHPWQKEESTCRALRGLTRKKKSQPWGWMRFAPPTRQHPSLQEIQKGWDSAAEKWDAGYGKYGDSYRQNIFNPALFSLLGDVKRKRILDAGCGAGYMSRLLTEKGARVIGVDLSKKFIEIAKHYERKKPLGIKYEQVNLANLSRFSSTSFDIVISVYVLCDTRDCGKAIREIARVLKPNGRFIFLIGHPCFDWQAGGWERVPQDSQRNEDCLYFKVDNYFKQGTLECQWGQLPILLSFGRPLSDYFRFLRKNGLLVRDLVEPRPIRRALRERPREWEREDRIPPVLIIDAVKLRNRT
jgi:SAM-dependent methyltransferase